MTTTVLVIGDIHFRKNHIREGQEFTEKTVKKAKTITNLNFIVLLGDILDSHERTDTTSYNLACNFIEQLSEISKVFVLIGNHDIADQNEFLSKRHFFNPLKKWTNVTIVDSVKSTKFHSQLFVFCPYVPKGRLREALETNTDILWETSTCIFVHQEVRGCSYGGVVSTDGDVWDRDLPPLISGHIHNSQKIGENVYYPGSSLQIKTNENPDKRVWRVTFAEDRLKIVKIDLKIKFIKKMQLSVDEIKTFDKNLVDVYNIVLYLSGSRDEFKDLKKSKLYLELRKLGVIIHFTPTVVPVEYVESEKYVPFKKIFHSLVEKSNRETQRAYKDLRESSE